MRYFLGFIALSLLTACAAPTVMPDGQPVSINKMLADTRGKPYECINYHAGSDTCEGIAKRRVRGDRIYYDVALLVPGPRFDKVRVNISANFKIEGGRYCGNMKRADIQAVGRLTPAQKSLLEEVILAEMISMGDICGMYVKDASGRYTSVTTDRAGRVMRDGVEPVWFFSGPKKLRLAL
ncbi:MAG: hypothetical protein HKP29_02320 [Silicimonas sp.]|nr:hypothetical protein [Silicimonas sp.]